MKTIKIMISIAGFVTTSFCFGQLFSQNNDELYYTAYYDISKNRMEHHIDHFPTRSVVGDYLDVPVFSRTYFVPIEYDIPVESWMTEPFESNYYEEEILVESWMTEPFEGNYYEEEILVESWMTRPFTSKVPGDEVVDEEIEVEAWMSKPWV